MRWQPEVKGVYLVMQKRRGPNADPVSEDDILRAIGKLKALGSGFQVIKVGSQRLVRSVPGELNTDKSVLLELAQTNGCISELQIEQVDPLPRHVPLYCYNGMVHVPPTVCKVVFWPDTMIGVVVLDDFID